MRKLFFIITALVILLFPGASLADSVLTLPVPEELFAEGADYKDVAHMVLEVSLPSKEKQPVQKVKRKKTDFSYCEFEPFPRVSEKARRMVRYLAERGLARSYIGGPSFTAMLSKRGHLTTTYDMVQALKCIFGNFMRMTDKQMARDFRLKKKDLDTLEYLAKEFTHELKLHQFNIDDINSKIAHARELLDLNQGIARVIKVVNDEKGGAVIHLLLKSREEQE